MFYLVCFDGWYILLVFPFLGGFCSVFRVSVRFFLIFQIRLVGRLGCKFLIDVGVGWL